MIAAHAVAAATDWRPEKPVEIISGVAPGGALDLMARAMQKIWQENRTLNVASTVVNRPGAGSAVGWTYMNQHPGDAHYVSVTSATLLTNSITGSNPLTYKDVTPLAQMLSEYIVYAVRADASLRSGRDLVERLKKDPTSVSFGIATTLRPQVAYGPLPGEPDTDRPGSRRSPSRAGTRATAASLRPYPGTATRARS